MNCFLNKGRYIFKYSTHEFLRRYLSRFSRVWWDIINFYTKQPGPCGSRVIQWIDTIEWVKQYFWQEYLCALLRCISNRVRRVRAGAGQNHLKQPKVASVQHIRDFHRVLSCNSDRQLSLASMFLSSTTVDKVEDNITISCCRSKRWCYYGGDNKLWARR